MKTLVMFNGEISGFVEDALKEGDVLTVEGQSDPLLVSLVMPTASCVGTLAEGAPTMPDGTAVNPEDIIDEEWAVGYDYIAYLTINERATRQYKKKTSKKLEKAMAKTIGGKTTPGSGAFNYHKGDVRSKEWLGEHKFTDDKQYRLTRATWNKIANEALAVGRTPVLEVVIDQEFSHMRLVFMNLFDFHEKTNATEEEFANLFYFKQYKTDKGSVLLKVSELDYHIQETYAISSYKLPGFFITFDNLTLFGIQAKHFKEIFDA